jgi:GT2 family glycosyltransferase
LRFTIIIPSAKIANVASCVAAIRRHELAPRIIVVADGIPEDARSAVAGVEWIEGIQPFCFARNINLGIKAAGRDDVILCNDDASLATPNGFTRMAVSARTFGIVSATINGRCCNPRQRQSSLYDQTEPDFLAFVCVYIPRSTIDAIGLLDEVFEVGNWEDNDYCRRAALAGIPLGICCGCTVDHPGGRSTFEQREDYRAILKANRARFEAKWRPTAIMLSVCICSLFSRKPWLDRLMATLSPQFTDGIEALLAVDAGQRSVGEKRQRLLEQARGDFIVFIDDDDLVSPNFLRRILGAIQRNPKTDAITFLSQRYCDGIFEANCRYSITSQSNVGFVIIDGIKSYQRWPYHVTPIRRELALQVGFPDQDHREDTEFAERLRPLLHSEEFIPEVLYTYFYRSDRSGEQTHRTLTKV